MSSVKVNRIVLYDPIEEMVYSRSVRKNSAGYREHNELQGVLLEDGAEALLRVARQYFAGLVVTHLPRK
ncbi:MAG: hypothetical protein GY832_20210 [Chloroflexi bacterium]|nr:hypothetical protein [Chloroflexota bacterium]